MSWSSDRARLEHLGVGPTMFCVFMVLMAVLGVISTSIAWQAGSQLASDYGPEFQNAVYQKVALTAVRPVLFIASAFMLFYSNSRWAVIVAIVAILYGSYGTILRLPNMVESIRTGVVSPFGLIDLLIVTLMAAYLLFSKEIERIYGLGSRRLLTRGVQNLWLRGRGRPDLDEQEAMRLDETFK